MRKETETKFCEYAKSYMTPCYKRDGDLALANDGAWISIPFLSIIPVLSDSPSYTNDIS